MFQSYVLALYSTLSRTQYDFTLPQVTFTSSGFHKHVSLTFNPTVRPEFLSSSRTERTIASEDLSPIVFCVPQRKVPDQDVAQGSYIALPLTLLLLLAAYNHEKVTLFYDLLPPKEQRRSHTSSARPLQVIPLLLQAASRIQGVRTMAQASSSDGAVLEDAKRQAKRQKARRT